MPAACRGPGCENVCKGVLCLPRSLPFHRRALRWFGVWGYTGGREGGMNAVTCLLLLTSLLTNQGLCHLEIVENSSRWLSQSFLPVHILTCQERQPSAAGGTPARPLLSRLLSWPREREGHTPFPVSPVPGGPSSPQGEGVQRGRVKAEGLGFTQGRRLCSCVSSVQEERLRCSYHKYSASHKI